MVEQKKENNFSKYLRGDKGVWAVFVLLIVMSMVMVYSASSSLYNVNGGGTFYDAGMRHFVMLGCAFFVVLVFQNINYRFLTYLGVLLYLAALGMLIGLSFMSMGSTINNASRWFMGFQPSEFMKLSLIILTSFILGKFQEDKGVNTNATWFIIALVAAGGGLIFIENFSTAALIFAVVYSMMFIGRVRWKFLVGLIGGALLIFCSVYIAAKRIPEIRDYKRIGTLVSRIDRHFFEDKNEKTLDIEGNDRQIFYSKAAIARSKGVGVFFGNSDLRNVLPQAFSDYIYAIVFEETGYFGALGVMLLYLILLYRAGVIARRCTRPFPAFLVMGCTLMLVYQAVFNMGVAVDLFPVTGQPLPLISRGGTSLIVSSVYIGIILSVSIHASKEGEKQTPVEIKEIDAGS